MALKLTSTAFQPGANIPKKFTCDGPDVSPALAWTDPPADTHTFALIMDDPDAPVGTWVHWVLYDLPPNTRDLAEGVPKQEEFIARNREKINARILMGVGASLDFLSGKKPRAPLLMRTIGLEWLFRLLHEPIRLGSRYLLGIPRFIWHIATMRFGRL